MKNSMEIEITYFYSKNKKNSILFLLFARVDLSFLKATCWEIFIQLCLENFLKLGFSKENYFYDFLLIETTF